MTVRDEAEGAISLEKETSQGAFYAAARRPTAHERRINAERESNKEQKESRGNLRALAFDFVENAQIR